MKKFLCALFALSLLASACGSDGTAANTATETAGATEDTNTNAEPDGPAIGSRFVYASPFAFGDLDPSSAFGTESIVLQNVYETLTRYNPPGSVELLSPALAESWESSEESTVWTFKLREGVTFHDGAPLTAEAVKTSIQRTIDLDLGAAFIFIPVIEINALDDLTVEFILEFPAPLDLAMSAGYGAYIMSPEAAAQDAAWFNDGNAAGTGPYTLASYTPGVNTELARFDDYWGGWTDDQFEDVVIELVEDPVLAEQKMRSGEAHFTSNLPAESYDALEEEAGLTVVRGQSMTNLTGFLNHERLSPEVREALVLSFPYDDVVAGVYGGQATRAQGIIPQAMWGSSSDLKLPETNLEMARDILDAAGETDLTVTYSFDAGTSEQQQIGELWQQGLSSIGVELVLEPLTFDARLELAQSDPANAQDIFTMFWFPTFVTPMDFMFSLFACEDEPFFNTGYYCNGDYDGLIFDADAITGTNVEGAVELFQQANQTLIDDNAAIFMLDTPATQVISSAVSGYVSNPGYTDVVRFYELTAAG